MSLPAVLGEDASRAAIREATAKLRVLLADGMDEAEIATRLQLSWPAYQELKRRFYELESETVRGRPVDQVYVDYVIAQRANIVELTRMIPKFVEEGQASAAVAAVKARSDIFDKIIEKGQEFGQIVMPQSASGRAVLTWSSEELRVQIVAELRSLDDLMHKAGKSLLDVDPGPLHRDVGFQLGSGEGRAKSKRRKDGVS